MRITIDDISLISNPIAYKIMELFFFHLYKSYKFKEIENMLDSFCKKEELCNILSELLEKKWLLEITNFTKRVKKDDDIEISFMLSFRGKLIMENFIDEN